MTAVRRAWRAAAPFALALAASACGPGQPEAPAGAEAVAPEGVSGFLAPPSLTAARWSADGHVRLEGRAPPGARVHLASPTGAMLDASAGTDGAWSVELAYAADPRLFALSAEAGARSLKAEGALAVVPPPAATALIARSGAPSWPVPPAAPGCARLVSADFDNGGGFGVSGYARPGARIRLMLDGRPAGQGQADASGRFAVLALSEVAPAPGLHRLTLDGGEGVDTRDVDLSAAPFLPAPFRAERRGDAWRIDWRAPAGVIQSMLVFDPRPAPGAAA